LLGLLRKRGNTEGDYRAEIGDNNRQKIGFIRYLAVDNSQHHVSDGCRSI